MRQIIKLFCWNQTCVGMNIREPSGRDVSICLKPTATSFSSVCLRDLERWKSRVFPRKEGATRCLPVRQSQFALPRAKVLSSLNYSFREWIGVIPAWNFYASSSEISRLNKYWSARGENSCTRNVYTTNRIIFPLFTCFAATNNYTWIGPVIIILMVREKKIGISLWSMFGRNLGVKLISTRFISLRLYLRSSM